VYFVIDSVRKLLYTLSYIHFMHLQRAHGTRKPLIQNIVTIRIQIDNLIFSFLNTIFTHSTLENLRVHIHPAKKNTQYVL